MKKLVKPMLVECEVGTLHIINNCLIESVISFGKLKIYNSTPKQLVLVSLEDDKKIIAIQENISPEYINQFVEEYNKGVVNPIDIEMVVDYTIACDKTGIECKKLQKNDNDCDGCLYATYIPRLTYGFVTIVSEELPTIDFKKASLYTEEEVLELCLKAFKLGFKLTNNPIPLLTKEYLKDWFNKNKKSN